MTWPAAWPMPPGNIPRPSATARASATVQAPGPERADAAWYTARAYRPPATPAGRTWYKGFTEVYTADARLPDALCLGQTCAPSAGRLTGALTLYDTWAGYPQSAAARREPQDQAGRAAAPSRATWPGRPRAGARPPRLPGADDERGRGRSSGRAGRCSSRARRRRRHALAPGRGIPHLLGAALRRPPGAATTVVPRDAGATAAARQRLRDARRPRSAAGHAAAAALVDWAARWSKPGRWRPRPALCLCAWP